MNALRPLAAAGAASSFLAWAVRGRSASVFGRSVWRGPRDRRALALTFDDGPAESTPDILEILAEHQVPATFFQCGVGGVLFWSGAVAAQNGTDRRVVERNRLLLESKGG